MDSTVLAPSAAPSTTSPVAPFVVDDLPTTRRTLRVALVTETYPPEINGVSMTLARVVEGLQERGHALQLVRPRQPVDTPAPDGSPAADEVLMRGLPIPNYPHLRMGLPARRALVSLWSHQRPDLVHVATEGPLGWSAVEAARRLKLPVCSDFRTNFHAYSRHYGLGWLSRPIVAYLRKFHNRTARTMVPTPALRDDLAAAGFQRLEVVARGVDTRRFHPQHRSEALRAQWQAAAGPVVLHVGRLAPEKNLGLLLDAFLALRQKVPAARLVLVGDGPARAELQRRCPEAVFAGAQTGQALAQHYASADLFLFPSLTETFGNVTPEAMASGLPVVAFRAAAAAQLVRPGLDGLLAPPADREEFIRHALALGSRADLMRDMGRRARVTAEGLGWDRIVTQVEGVFEAALREAGPATARRLAARSLPA
jgi:glycosyltransferase involved in cell wall biosynthesis